MRLHSIFEQQKGSGLVFFFRFWGHRRLWSQNQKKVSPDPFHANVVRKVYTAKISGPYQLFLGPDPFFSVHSFFFYKNVVFPGQAEYSYFSADFWLKILLYYS